MYVEGHEGFFPIPRLTALPASGGLVISRSYGRVKPALIPGGQASPLHCSRSSLRGINVIEATAASGDTLEFLSCPYC